METRWNYIIVWAALCFTLGSTNKLPVFTRDMNGLLLSESTPVGTVVYTLQGVDPKGLPLKYNLVGTDRFSLDPVTGDVTLSRPLDREVNDTIKFLVSLEDEDPDGIQNLSQTQLVTVIVLDENDNSPTFKNSPYEVSVPADEEVETTILTNIEVEDMDEVGDSLQVGCVPNEQWPDDCSTFEVVTINSTSHQYTGALVLKKPLNYNERQFYQYQLYATDGSLNSTTYIEIKVVDVQNSPPVFSGSLSGALSEDAPVGTARAQPRDVVLELVNNALDFFLLDSVTGELKTAKPLDREALDDPLSPLNLTVRATDDDGSGQSTVVPLQISLTDSNDNPPVLPTPVYNASIDQDAVTFEPELQTTEVVSDVSLVSDLTSILATSTITIEDVNEEPPTFNHREYFVEIPESLNIGTPLPNLDMVVTDTDLGLNSVFSLRLSDDLGAFIVEPSTATGNASVTLKLNFTLHYEDPTQRKFILEVIAEELFTNPRLSSKANVIISLTDVNDNVPQFLEERYSATVAEGAPPGTNVTAVRATDRDQRRFGTEGIVYQLSGNGTELFQVDNRSGVITVAPCETPGTPPCLDYETRKDYFLTYKATDDDGSGQSTVVPLQISLTDSNDNPPVLPTPVYNASIDQDAVTFEPELQTTEVVSDVSLVSDLTSILATSTITIEDVNEEPPTFNHREYFVEIPESLNIGTPLPNLDMVVTDTDLGLNSVFSLRLSDDLGAFIVEPSTATGNASVTLKLNFTLHYEDPTQRKFILEVIAEELFTNPRLSSKANVIISLTDVNDNVPQFLEERYSATVAEGAPPGTNVTAVRATDRDQRRFGTEGIVYQLSGNGTELFQVDNRSGVITVAPCETPGTPPCLDYETRKDYFLTYKATDDDGSGQSTVVPLQISLTDSNDNPPVLPTPVYNASIDQDAVTFEPELQTTEVVSDVSLVSDLTSTLATSTITIEDVNEEPPTFNHREYFVEIPESLNIGTPLPNLDMVVTDTDLGLNSVFSLRLSDDLGAFIVEPSTATGNASVTLKLNFTLHYEDPTQRKFILEVIAEELFTNPRLSSKANVIISLTDVNDNVPQFLEERYSATVAEGAPPGTNVTAVRATDRDQRRFGTEGIVYQLSGNGTELFQVDNRSGVITVAPCETPGTPPCLDYETRKDYFLTYKATDDDGSGQSTVVPLQISLTDSNDNPPVLPTPVYNASIDQDAVTFEPELQTTEVVSDVSLVSDLTSILATSTITIEDVNEEPPTFNHREYFVEIPESLNIGTPLPNLDMVVTDTDLGLNSVFSLRLSDDLGAFIVEPSTATGNASVTLKLNFTLHYEDPTQRKFILEVIAEELFTNPRLSSKANVIISLTDVNDNVPQFLEERYSATVAEGAPPGTNVTAVRATDRDQRRFGTEGIVYQLSGNGTELFQVDNRSGVITVAPCETPGTPPCLDYETRKDYFLTYKATDDDGSGQSTVVPLQISLTDSNDNPPVLPTPVYNASIDQDAVTFEPELQTTEVVSDVSLVSDLTSILATSTITIEDVNEEPPTFNHREYFVEIPESLNIGTPLPNLDMVVTDTDLGLNSVFSLRLSDDLGAFIVEPSTATGNASVTLKLNFTLHYEDPTQRKFILEVIAEELFTNPRLSSKANVIISLTDVNDNVPQFLEERYSATVAEGAPPGTNVTAVRATDRDQRRFGTEGIVYQLSGNGTELFQVDNRSGVITVAPCETPGTPPCLDYETRKDYFLTYKATDDDGSGQSTVVPLQISLTDSNDNPPVLPTPVYNASIDQDAVTFEPELQTTEVVSDVSLVSDLTSTLATSTITIEDVNEEPPTFNHREYFVEIPESLNIGTPLPNLDMVVTDTDLGLNSVFSLRLSDDLGAFIVEPSTATGNASVTLKLNFTLHYEDPTQRKFILEVIAEELFTNPRLSSKANVIISLTDVNDNVPQFLEERYSATVAEGAPPGTNVTAVRATDRDQRRFGTEGIVYQLSGNGTELFQVDNRSGVITVAPCETPGTPPCLDYETRKDYFLTYKATDDDGSGQSTVVPLQISLTDSNDNTPVLPTPVYNASIDQDAVTFEPELQTTEVVSDVSLVSDLTSTLATSTITIEDVNEEPPTFNHREYFVEIPESLNIGTPLPNLDMVVTDTDLGLNSVFSLRLSDDLGAFIVEPSTGTGNASVTLKLNSTLDYEDPTQRKFILEVIAEELFTNPRLSSKANVIISLTDVNDNVPQFLEERYSATVAEGAPPGTNVTAVRATDRDQRRFGTEGIVYQLSGNGTELFQVDNRSGVITVAPCETPGTPPCLDYETRKDYFLTYKATDDDGSGQSTVVPLQISLTDSNDNPPVLPTPVYNASIDQDAVTFEPELQTTEVVSDVSLVSDLTSTLATSTITIEDVNEEPPTFNHREYFVEIPESLNIGTPLPNLDMVVTDTDLGLNSVFSLRLSDDLGAFIVEPSTGTGNASVTLKLNSTLDYEDPTQRKFILEVIAEELFINPRLSSKANVIISLTDVNDNVPQFLEERYSATVAEGAPPGTNVTAVRATDRDQRRFGTEGIVYQLSGNGTELFQVDNRSGVITVAPCETPGTPPCLDYETRKDYFLTYKATDDDGSGQSTVVPLQISLTDSNDNPPVLPTPVYNASIDQDAVTFEPELQTTEVVSDVSLVSDLTSTLATSTITIEDVNEEPPTFNHREYFVEIPESLNIGTPLPNLDMVVTDTDLGLNSVFSLRLSDDLGAFIVEPSTGTGNASVTLKLNSTLDYEDPTQRKFILEVIAEELFTNPRLSSKANVIISLTDVNDNVPQFLEERYSATVAEGAPPGTNVTAVRATDRDQRRFGTEGIVYQLSGNGTELFQVDNRSGVITVAPCETPGTPPCLDYETRKDYFLTYKATDDDGSGQSTVVPLQISLTDSNDNPPVLPTPVYNASIDQDAVTFEPELQTTEVVSDVSLVSDLTSTLATVTITIEDVNEEPPTFNHREYFVEIPESLNIGTPLPNLDMVVTDTDLGLNSVFSLRLSDDLGAFIVEPSTGTGNASVTLKLNSTLDYEDPTQRKFILEVIAEELFTNPRLSSRANVIISLTDVNDNVPQFLEERYSATVAEGAPPGTNVTAVRATDRDQRRFGTEGIVYQLSGNGTELFQVDNRSGVITVAPCETPGTPPCLDYETRKDYFLTYKATDDDGSGQSTVVSLQISLTDFNDNPPVLPTPVYKASIDEDAVTFEPELQVQARDVDVTSEIRYSIIEPAIHPFWIDSTNGKIAVKPIIGGVTLPEDSNKIFLTILATDGVHNATCRVEITVRDVNNHAPVFVPDKHDANISEDAPIGTEVAVVSATDMDSGINSELKYSIQKGAFDAFAVHNVSGVVTVASKLDYDKRNTYRIQIIATDFGIPSLTGTTELTVHVTNVNDKPPAFAPATQRAEVSADAPLGTLVHRLLAVDPDVSDSARLIYDMSDLMIRAVDNNGKEVSDDGIFGSWFTVQPDGSVVVSQQLGRSRAAVLTLPVRVTDTEATVLQQAEGELIIIIVNPRAPVFSQISYLQTLEEEQPIGTVLATYSATDAETPIAAIVIHPPSPYFQIDNVTGVVKTTQRIDYEKIHSINFTLIAFDSGVPQLSTSAGVTVTIVNANDENPAFDALGYEASVEEHVAPGTSVLTVSGKDNDEGKYGEITYSLAGNFSLFSIDRITGVITVAEGAVIDRELITDVYMSAVASDNAPPRISRMASVPVHIKINDINDHAPIFNQKVYKATIAENLQLNPPAAILQVLAVDKDDGLNGKVRYSIVEQNEPGVFTVDPSSGIISPPKPVVGNTTYHLTVIATDEDGSGPHSEHARVDISVLSVNRHKPVFVNPRPEQRQLEIPEIAAQADYLITTIQATDADSGDNGRVSYYLKENNQNVGETAEFSLDKDTGELRTKTFLDREHKAEYQLFIVAADNGTPSQFESLQLLTVVLDANDNIPRFSAPMHQFSISENLLPGVIIGTVKATDKDSGENGKVYYHVLEGNQDGAFTVDRTQGIVRANISFDREQQSEYSLTVYASNDPILDDAAAILNSVDNSTFGQDPSVTFVKIRVLDENDNEPKFQQKVYYAGIMHTAHINEPVLSVVAEDPDLGKNGTIKYMVAASNLYKFGAQESSGSVVPSPFNISQDGVLMVSHYMSQYNHDRFVLDIIAEEMAPPHRQAKAKVYVWIIDRFSLIRMVVSRSCATAVSGVSRRLGSFTNAMLVPGTRLPFEQADRRYDDWCEIHLLAVDPASYQVLPVDSVLETIDSKYDELKDVYQEYGVETLIAARAISKAPDSFGPELLALIALLIVLFTGIVTFVVVCACLKHCVIPPPLMQSSLGDGLSRRHILAELSTTENPLWLATKLRPDEEQELTMNVFGGQGQQIVEPAPVR